MHTVESRRRALMALAGITMLPWVCAAQSGPSTLSPFTVAGWSKPISEITNLLVEPDKGFFRNEGLDLVYMPGAGGGDAIRNLLSGQADVAFTDPGSFFMAIDKGEKLKAIYDIYPQNVFNVVSLASSQIHRPEDLKGKRIGVYSLSSGTRQNLLVLLHRAGLTENDVEIVVTGVLNFAPLMQGRVDALAATDTGLLVGRQRGLGEVNVMQVRDSLNLSSDMFVVRESDYVEKAPLLRSFLKGYRNSAQWMIDHPDEAATLAMKRAIDGTNRDMNAAVIAVRNEAARSSPTADGQRRALGDFDMAAWQQGADAYFELGLIKQPIDVSRVVDKGLLPESGRE